MNACHVLDYMCWLVGSGVSEATACAATLVQPTEVEDTISISYRYQSGAIGSLDATTTLAGPFLYEQRLWGRNGQLIVAPELKFWSTRTISGYEAGRWHVVRDLPRGAERRQYFEHFAVAVLEGGEPPVRAAEARAVQAAMEAAYASVDSGAQSVFEGAEVRV